MNSHALRERLREINMSSGDQQEELDSLSQEYAHNCRIIASPLRKKPELFNCFMFALGIHNDNNAQKVQDKRRLPLDHPLLLAERSCISLLTSLDQIAPGDVVYYVSNYDGKRLPVKAHHAGTVESLGEKIMIISKWGRGNRNCIWLHPQDEVPSLYEDSKGDITTLFFRVDKTNIKILVQKTLQDEQNYLRNIEDQKSLWEQ